jgi:4-hydroxy-tetrahydrodipicolinate synthase
MTLELEGVYVPVVTPFDGNGDVDLATLGAVIERGLEAGVGGIVSCGTTGEYYALSESERVDVMRHTHDVAAGRAQLVAGCNAGSTRTAIQLARVAGDIGYDALMLAVPPTSLPRADELVAHFTAIAEASGVPTILYNYPARAGVEIGFDCLDQVADHPLIVGIKESSGDFSCFLAMRERYAGRITIMCGSDDQAADYFFWGVRSWLAGTANVLPRQHVEILNAANSGDLAGARKQFEQILPWVQHMEAGSYNQKTKLGLRHLGLDCGEVRQPLLPLSDADAATLVEILDGVLR